MNKCINCNKEFTRKYDLDRHQKRKIPCNRIINCNNCLTIFKTKQGLSRHLNRKNPCKKKDLEQENKELKEEINKLKNNKLNITNINNTQNINNNTQNINNINNIFFIDKWDKLYGNLVIDNNINKETIKNKGLDTLMNKEIINTEGFKDNKFNLNAHKDRNILPQYNHIKQGKNMYLHMIKLIYINIKYPENWIFIYNKLTEEISIKLDNQFKKLNTNLLKLIYEILKILIEDELIDNNLKNIYKIFIERYENNYEPDEDMKEEYENELNNFIENSEEEILNALKKLEKELIQKIKDRNKNIEN